MPRKTKQPVDLSFAFELPPEAAMKYFRSKGHTLSWNWYDTLGEAHAKAFTVAHVARMDVLQDIRGAVDQAIADGQTFREFRKNLEPTLKKKGWWGRKMVVNKKGVAESVLEGSPHRLATIYHTNMKSAYSAGREEFFQKNKAARPYGQYVAIIDPKTRDKHRKLHKKTFPLDDPFWASFTPPLGYRCRCRKRALSEAAVKRRGIKVLSSKGRMVREDQLVSKKTGELRKVTGYRFPGGGKVFPQVGFDNNPWKAAWQPDLNKYDYDIAKKYVEGTVTGPDFKRFFDGKKGGKFPVGVLDPKTRKKMGVRSQAIFVSKKEMKHVRKAHPDMDIKDFAKIQEIADNGRIVKPSSGKTEFQFFANVGNSKNVYALPLSEKQGDLFVSTFFRASQRYRKVKTGKGKTIRREK